MALRVAIASGNWSNPAIWNGGVLPNPGDIVASNNFTVTIDQNINVGSLTNAAQSLIDSTPNMTSPTSPSGIVTASSEDPGNPAWRAFNGVYDYPAWYGTGSGTQFIAYEFVSPIRIDRYQLSLRGDTYDPKDWTFEAWNGSAWIILDTVVNRTISANYMSPVLNNPTAYIKYRLNITGYKGAGTVIIIEFDMYPYLGTTAAIAGGGFIVSTTQTITCTSSIGIQSGTGTALTVSASSPSVVTLNSSITPGSADGTVAVAKSGTCTLNVTGSILSGGGSNRNCLVISAAGTVNFVGNVRGFWQGCYGIILAAGSSGAVLNITGNINPDKSLSTSQNENCILISSVCTVNITGNIYAGLGTSNSIIVNAAASIYVTGNVYGGQSTNSTGSNGVGIISSSNGLINVVGMLNAQHTPSYDSCAIVSSSGSALNIFSGPFVCSPYGTFPYQVVRMHLIPTTNSYIEFRDETTNGALSPGAIAPATRLVSPATLVDNLAPSDVRFGTSYALGTLTGTLRMPVANQVTFGVQVDNTFGNAVLTADGIWNYLVSNLNTPDSIGMRLKNVSTPQTTGEQLEAFLRLD